MTEADLDKLALLLCAAVDDGEPCDGGPCASCKRAARVADEFINGETKH